MVQKEILEIIGWYKSKPSDYNNINELLYARKQLSTLSVYLSTEVSSSRKDWKMKEMKLEIEKNKKRISYSDKLGTTKADYSARANTEDELIKSVEAECDYYDRYYIYNAVKEVLNELNQRISYLRDEDKQTKYFDNN